MKPKKDLIIIGAGLSGLLTALLLQEEFNITLLEARERLGGRILTQNGHDLGPSWVWSHQKNILGLIHELKLELFAQYTKGEALYDAPQGVQRFLPPPSAPSARVHGGLEKLIQELAAKLSFNTVHLNQEARKVVLSDAKVQLETATDTYTADYIISTLPPRLACENILYEPALTDEAKEIMLSIPTWMGHSAKCLIEFTHAFWKDEGLSGFVFSHLGPLGEIHDASTKEKAALFGFVHHNASTDKIEEDVREQIERLFGDKSELISDIIFMDWRNERFSSAPLDRKGLQEHPDYGIALDHFGGRLLFSGTETAYDNGGYLEGAVISAMQVSKRLRSIVL